MARNPIKDQVAIVGVGSTGFSRDSGGRSSASLGAEASLAAIRDAGITPKDIDGIVAVMEPGAQRPHQVAATLGIPNVTFFSSPMPVAVFGLMDAINAVFSGTCDTALLVYSMLRAPWASRSAAMDPFRKHLGFGAGKVIPESLSAAPAYTAWASRYIHEYAARREDFGYVALNSRANAARNPLAAIDAPLTMDDYLSARMIRDPLCLLDMDLPVDGADAFVVTTAERARDMCDNPVLIHAANVGMVDMGDEDQLPSLNRHGQHVVIEKLKASSDVWIDDIDVFFPYDGFTIITLGWIENVGFCAPGEGGRFLESNWDEKYGAVLINGRVPINPHGGSLSEGATRGSGHIREAVVQLRGDAGERQVENAQTALVTPGGFFFNSQGTILRRG